MDNSNPIIDVKVQLVKLYGEYRYYCGDSDEYAAAIAIAISALAEVTSGGE